MEKEKVFPHTIIAVTPNHNLTVLVRGDAELVKLMDGDLFDDNSQADSLAKFPSKPGIYTVTIEYWFKQGYFEGWPSDGESKRDFRPVDIQETSPITS